MSKPVLYAISAFDASKEHTFTFSFSGEQIIETQANIYNNETNALVYSGSYTTSKAAFVLPAGSIKNSAVPYNITIRVVTNNNDNKYSEYSDKEQFYCVSSPTFDFKGLDSANLNTIRDSSYLLEIEYSVPSGEKEQLDSYQYFLYNSLKVMVDSSPLYYADGNTFLLSYLSDDTNYYVRAMGTTQNGMKIDTGYVPIYVDYEKSSTYLVIEPVSRYRYGDILIKSNIASIDGWAYPTPEQYCSAADSSTGQERIGIDLTQDGSYVVFDENYQIPDTFDMELVVMKYIPNRRILLLKGDGEQLELFIAQRKFSGDGKTYTYALLITGDPGYTVQSNKIVDEGHFFTISMKRENWLYELKITPNDKLETLYTVKFTGVNGIKNQYVKSGALLTDPGDQVKEGYTFEGWYNGSKKWNFAKDTVTSDMTLEAKFTRDVSVTYTLDNATSSNTVSTTKENESFATTITASANYVIDSITVIMNGKDVSSDVVSDNKITISKVTGPIEITVKTTIQYKITQAITNAKTSNGTTYVKSGSAFTTTITPETDYDYVDITVSMGGTDITSTAVKNNVVTIDSVTGAVQITAEGKITERTAYTVTVNYSEALSTKTYTAYEGKSYTLKIAVGSSNFAFKSATVKMGGVDITDSVLTGRDVYIENVTGDIDIDVVLIQTFQIFGAYQNVIRSNEGDVVGYGGTFECTYTPQSGYNAVSITVKKGDITGTVVDGCVTGNTVRIENVKSNYYIMANGYKVKNWDVTYDLTNATSSNSDATVELNGSYKTTISGTDPYRLKSVTVTMDDVDISNDVVTWESGKYGILTYNNATIKIPEVTGKLNISVVGSMMYSILKKTSDCKTTNETSIGIIAGQVWDGDTYFCAYVPSSGYTSCNIKVYKGSDSTGEEVTNSVVGKTTIDGVTYDSVTIKNVKQVYYTDASGVK